jgi:C-terminal processing protease CtpA/Prc
MTLPICYFVPGPHDHLESSQKGRQLHVMRVQRFLIWVPAVVLLCVGSARAFTEDEPPQTRLTEVQKIYGFSQFWKEVSYNFAHWETTGDLKWDKAYEDFLPRIMATGSDFEYYRELQRFCALLKDGHTNVYLPNGMLEKYVGRIPLQLRAIDHRAIVSNMDVALAAEIPAGSEILEVDGRPIKAMIEEEIIPMISTSAPHIYWEMAIGSWRDAGVGVLFGPKGSTASLKIRKPDGDVVMTQVARDQYERGVEWAIKKESTPLSTFRMLEGNVAYIALNSFSDNRIVDAFQEQLARLAKASGIIIDLRDNTGGSSLNASAIVGHLTDKPFRGASWRTPVNYGVYKAWGAYADSIPEVEEYREYYTGHVYHREESAEHEPSDGVTLTAPTIVLIGRKTASAAEDFLVMADGLDHVRYLGEPTFGSTGQPLMMDLPGGGSARISTKRDFFPDGRDFIGVGVRPDIEVRQTVEAFLLGKDEVLENALSVLLRDSAQ